MSRLTLLHIHLVLAVTALAQPVIDIASADVTAGSLAPAVASFSAADPAAIVARAPAPGAARRVARLELLRWANGLGLNPEHLPEELTLRRAMRPLTDSEIERAIRSVIKAGEVSLDILSAIWPAVPAGEIELECLCSRLTLNQPTPLRLRWREPGGRTGIESVQAVARVEGRWFTAAADLPSGTALLPPDVVERHGALPELNSYLTEDQLDGRWTLVRSAKSGEALTRDLVRTAPLVSRGDLVELRYVAGGIRLRSPGRAEESGSTGDLIPFHNVATGGRVNARLADRQTAYIEASHAAR